MKIISGGQTGVDRGALDAALDLGIDVGGWCPNGRRAEDGKVPARYAFLMESTHAAYTQRTRWNVRDADVTLVLHAGDMGPGTKVTMSLCKELKKPHAVIDIRDRAAVATAIGFLNAHAHAIINVAGPRESTNHGIHDLAHHFMTVLLKELS